jgi:hypothetical protein
MIKLKDVPPAPPQIKKFSNFHHEYKLKIRQITELNYPYFAVRRETDSGPFYERSTIVDVWDFEEMKKISSIDQFLIQSTNLLPVSLKNSNHLVFFDMYEFLVVNYFTQKIVFKHQNGKDAFLNSGNIPNSNSFFCSDSNKIYIFQWDQHKLKLVRKFERPKNFSHLFFLSEEMYGFIRDSTMNVIKKGKKCFSVDNINSFILDTFRVQTFQENFVIYLDHGFYFYQNQKMKWISMFDTMHISFVDHNILCKVSTSNKMEFFHVDPFFHVRVLKSVKFGEKYFHEMFLNSKGNFISYSGNEFKVWETSTLMSKFLLLNHFPMFEKIYNIGNVNFHFQ